MLKRDQVIARALAFFSGTVMFFFLPSVLALLLGHNSPLLLPLLVAFYGACGVVFGLLWPDGGWRLGLYLFAIWPPMLLFALFLGGEVLMEGGVNVKVMLRDLLGYLMIMIVACLGAEIGALIRRRMADTALTA